MEIYAEFVDAGAFEPMRDWTGIVDVKGSEDYGFFAALRTDGTIVTHQLSE